MREALARQVIPVLEHAAALHARLAAGGAASLKVEQAALRDLLTPLAAPPAPGSSYLGVHYALVCWLDELFVLDSPWGAAWNEAKLEAALYATNDRAWKFWEQAELAAREEGPDAEEVFFLCVALGFRGERAADPDALRAWLEAARRPLLARLGGEWDGPADLEPPASVPPRRGRRRLRVAAAAGAAALVLAAPAAVALIARSLEN